MTWATRAVVAVAFAILVAAGGCKPHVGPVAHVVIDCLAQDQGKLESLAAELLPLLFGETPRWSTFEEKAIAAGVNIGGCVAADLIQKYLAPAPGNAAPSPDNGINARASYERVREKFGGVSFKTKAGEL